MNSNNIFRAVVVLICLIAAGSAHAFVGTLAVSLGQLEEIGPIQTSFSADAVLETEEMTAQTKVYYQPGMVRDEMDMEGQQMVTIRRFDQQVVWTILGQGMYMETAADERNERAPNYKLVSREIIGPEIVNGMATIKYKSVYETEDGKMGGFTWFTDDNIAVKGFMVSESKGEKVRMKFEITSLTRGPQDDALFVVPAGYQKFDMGAMAGMRGMMNQQGGAGGYGAPPPGTASPSPGTTAPPPGTASAPAQPQTAEDTAAPEQDSMADVVVDEAQSAAEDTAREETRRGVRDSIKKGFGKIFGR